MRLTKSLLLILLLLQSAATLGVTDVKQRVDRVEKAGELPKPLLEQLVAEGIELEQATKLLVESSATGVYAQAFTFYAICMSISDLQAERVRDIAIGAARPSFKELVRAEARFSLLQFKSNRCSVVERTPRVPPVSNDDISEALSMDASMSK